MVWLKNWHQVWWLYPCCCLALLQLAWKILTTWGPLFSPSIPVFQGWDQVVRLWMSYVNGSMLKAKGRREKRFGKGQMKAKKGRKKRPTSEFAREFYYWAICLDVCLAALRRRDVLWPSVTSARNLRIHSASSIVRHDGYLKSHLLQESESGSRGPESK